ncbi:hypothetical protein [Flavihumibacter petaseus]|uniref:Uncharacterized protein n=1 Tax=Flavihumibacter petaseus NBRC 106054 TaxID=1220578 RepID=A0A0E9N319_9BACT|nr:hypothetical protein [Flavihumibacter petaseus]GAO44188.1 hypothetical protein FPE01S_03_02260 [Flavihumibacter petaseus NBRC 106054]
MPDRLSDRIQQWETPPPQGAWEAIAATLREDRAEQQLRDRLLPMEATPPPAAWSAIAGALAAPSISENTYTYTVTPDAVPVFSDSTSTDQSLPETQHPKKAMVVPIRPLYPYLFRYSAVAAVIALLVWVLNRNPEGRPEQDLGTAITAPAKASTVPPTVTPATPTPTSAKDELEALNSSVTSKTSDPDKYTKPLKTARPPRLDRHAPASTSNSISADDLRATTSTMRNSPQQELPVQQKDPRYISITNEAGQTVRLSSKFAPLYYQLTGQADQPDPNGKRRKLLQLLEDRMTRVPFVPDPQNFFDIMLYHELLQAEQ